ncbi:hypothetical protein FHS61_002934 [Altererythrobacter atlanticus]|uniref:Uncharacterized protein n=1 Tax=Croceibacterium atlanticum TaxID=1267766 RepID=A0A0F7KT97_9SPHN|nr:hypothetical protein [Croceibacterium atlanticum]AKH43628.1 hypothetical protein WYH_02598 [Croceibacterium atlanticum]MBB5733888.1 hypothetical protein [Croceibacterium atlanticum]
MELIAILISAILGWQIARLGPREIKGIAVATIGCTVALMAAQPFDLSLEGILFTLVYNAGVITVPYVAGMLLRQLRTRMG